MKLIHTADICLDRCYADQNLPSSVGRENRAHLRTRLQAILDRAVAWSADAILITGNLFDLERIDRDTVAFLREAFGAISPIPVLITPGSHDPGLRTSPYATELWPENVHVLSDPAKASVTVRNFSIYGLGYNDAESSANPLASFSAPEDRPFIVMASGLLADLATEDSAGHTVASLELIAHPNLAYVALGNPAQTTAASAAGPALAWYSGAPEGAGFSDAGPQHYLEVTIPPGFPDSQDAVLVNPVAVSGGRFYAMTLDCTDLANGQDLIDAIRPHLVNEPDRQCVRVVLEGALLPEIYDELVSIREVLSEEVAFLDLIDRCFVAENYETLAEQKTSLGAFVARINQEIDDAPDALHRAALCRSRDLALCAYRGQHLPIRAAWGD